MLRKLKWQLPGQPLAARYNCCQVPISGRGPAVEKYWSRLFLLNSISLFLWPANKVSQSIVGHLYVSLDILHSAEAVVGEGIAYSSHLLPCLIAYAVWPALCIIYVLYYPCATACNLMRPLCCRYCPSVRAGCAEPRAHESHTYHCFSSAIVAVRFAL